MHGLNHYAQQWRIRLPYRGYGVVYCIAQNTGEYRGEVFRNWGSYPDGVVYQYLAFPSKQCGIDSSMMGSCRANESLNRVNESLHQEVPQVINAQYAWNAAVPRSLVPGTFEEGRRRWHALMKGEDKPGAVLREDLRKRAGVALAGYLTFHQERTAGELPPFYPLTIFPLNVLCRYLEGDCAYWDRAASAVEARDFETLGIACPELQRRLAALWSQTADVNQKAEQYLADARRAGDLREDARADFDRLLLCNQAGQRMACLLATYHRLFAGSENSAQVLAMDREFRNGMHGHIRSDFSEPKGGDASSRIEAAEILRSNLLARAN
jgi:hypothetical protein